MPVGPVPRLFLPLVLFSLASSSITGTFRALTLTNQIKDLLRYAGDTNSNPQDLSATRAKLDAKLTDALKKAGAEVYDVVKDRVVRRNLD